MGECDIPEPIVNVTKTEISLLQINEYADTLVRYCKVEIKRTVAHCGMWSHISQVKNGEVKYLQEVTRDECTRMHFGKMISIAGTSLGGLRINDSVTYPITFAGSLKADGSCANTGHYADPYGEFYDIVVHGYVTIKLEERLNAVNLNNNKIRLESGTQCAFSEDHCVDMQFGYAFWDMIPTGACEARKYTSLYTGPVLKVVERENVVRYTYWKPKGYLSLLKI